MLVRIFLTSLLGAAAASVGPALLAHTTSGPVQGFMDDTNGTTVQLKKWYGIRYAQDTSGNNRWRPPRPYSSKATFDGHAFGPACIQAAADGGNGTEVQSEDCLRINVIAPVNASGLPIYLYTHGGGYTTGASSDPKIDGSYMAERGLVFASYNYRLALFGYPHSSEIKASGATQNIGLLDTRAAVEWIRANARVFGGDPDKIVLGGESVGAETTNQYMSGWPDDPLIRGAVMQSADTAQPMWPIDQQLKIIATNVSCTTGKGMLDCLRKTLVLELQSAQISTNAQFQPVTDNRTIFYDYVAQTKAGHTNKVPLLIGTNHDEGTLIVNTEPTAYFSNISAYCKSNNLNIPWNNVTKLEELYPVPSTQFPATFNATAGMWRDAHMLCLAHNLATHRTDDLVLPVWRYRFDLLASNLNSQGTSIGTFHGSDIRFVMGTWRTIIKSQPFVAATPEEIAISNLMVTAWTNFIKDPTKGPEIPGWKKYDTKDTTSLAILGLNTNGADPGDHFSADASCAYWNKLLHIFPQTFPECGSWTC
ncbi:carboxylesterase [Punctularia strigosozonata HHB-11173 SS5]|uniref:carboxylesterase n=1 Tax=Punctularia strigosozonata (strain HHB-11173) TaxID=741275 RepID=UPI00044169D4|nr:carboxylesterase [Punctularia strigosozonata HHB-11173 SS5]EIN08033.1 carboxylesterase [Punctularia strigosozonata HHB-11173 SS5]